MKQMELILVVEDDGAIAKILEISLQEFGFKTRVASSLSMAKREFLTQNPSVIILDLGLPDGDGKGLIPIVRKASSVPIIVLSARSDEREIIAALDLGADDYVTKPFSVSELLARIRSSLRRRHHEGGVKNRLTCKEITIDFERKEVYLRGELLKFTPTEYQLLAFLMQNANRVLPHQHILRAVWGVGYQHQMQYLRTYINMLRKKIEINSTRPTYITTEASIGYRFSCESEGVE
jgi:two-component system KDP operon response regulator KdpE